MLKKTFFSMLFIMLTLSLLNIVANDAKQDIRKMSSQLRTNKIRRSIKKKKKINVVDSWKKLISFQWNKLSGRDVWNIAISSVVSVGGIVGVRYLLKNNNNQHVSTSMNGSHNAYSTNSTNNIRKSSVPADRDNVSAGRPLVSNSQADYVRINANCVQIREQFAGMCGGSGRHHAIYQYLVRENSSAARRVMEELIRDGILADYRRSYGIE